MRGAGLARRRATTVTAVTAALAVGLSGTAWAAAARPGASGLGDAYYPSYGNGGYDVGHYKLDVSYDPASDLVTGKATITAKATQDLSRFDLDFGLHAQSVTVNGHAARTRTDDLELVVTPRKAIKNGASMTVVVVYAGVPSSVTADGYSPWIRTDDGAVAVGEPQISSWWFPGNDHPRDKATYDIKVTVPAGLEALSNGKLVSHGSTAGKEVWSWSESRPMATYLAYFAVGQFDITQSSTASGLPVITAVASNGGSEGTYAAADLARTGEVIDWHARHWGPYPFNITGGVAPAADFGFALENQTRPVYTRGFWRSGPNIYVVVHEQAHQWYGDSVSVDQWKDIWLNEGFASFAEWAWSEEHGDGTGAELLQAYYDGIPASDPFWQTKIGDPGKDHEFTGAVYDRGAMTLQALRQRIGDPAFWQLMRNWPRQHKYGNGSIPQFIALAERLTGEDLGGFFDAWLYSSTKPAATPENGFPAAMAGAAAARAGGSRAEVPRSKAKIDAVHRVLLAQAQGR
ncbi:M1 family metallopeptidase [Angustibacter sp. McL0619]|uniref:M1 family metallopeptidase n=1 Tax=Angustibacter sp. McL0619 TaxID=3415676 RepID=UPI003CEF031B